jgi:hypothetical protein
VPPSLVINDSAFTQWDKVQFFGLLRRLCRSLAAGGVVRNFHHNLAGTVWLLSGAGCDASAVFCTVKLVMVAVHEGTLLFS